jgi:malonyl-CoA O-methyltransferase
MGVDLVPDMLARAAAGHTGVRPLLAAADVLALPIRSAAFDILWCRLVLGHVRDLAAAYRELGRVAARSATLIVTDFHPAARAAGHERIFRDADGLRHIVEHHDHGIDAHVALAGAAGWRLAARRDLAVGPAVRPFYERAGALDRYAEQAGLALVLLLVLTR